MLKDYSMVVDNPVAVALLLAAVLALIVYASVLCMRCAAAEEEAKNKKRKEKRPAVFAVSVGGARRPAGDIYKQQ